MYHEHKKEAASKQTEALNLEAASQELTKSIPPDCSSVQKGQNGTVTNGPVESDMNGDVSAGGFQNKAYVLEDGH